MMRLARRASLIVAFFLLTSAATASAECAWVRWQKERHKGRAETWTTEMKGESFFETREACEQKRTSGLEAELRRWNDADYQAFVSTIGVAVSRKGSSADDYLFIVDYQCFPDTVDPRGPKGK
jgi:hypothetical protein